MDDLTDSAATTPPPFPPPLPAPGQTPPRQRSRGRGCLWLVVGIGGGLLLLAGAIMVALFGAGLYSALQQGITSGSGRYLEHLHSGDAFAKNKIALVDIQGIIISTGSSWSPVAAADVICEQLQQAGEDDAVKAVIVRINSPGGEVTASDMIHHRLRQLREEHGKVVVAVMESVAASGGLYVAVGADRIVAHRMTVTGSIGVIAQSFSYHQLLEKIGVQAETYKSGQMKDLLSGTRPRTEAEREFMNRYIRNIYEEFVRIVAAGRPNLAVEDILDRELGDGRILSGQDAWESGLVDDLGFFEDAVALAAELAEVGEDYKLVYYQPPFSFSAIFSQLRAEPKVTLELPGVRGDWTRFIEPGKAYFLPAP